MKIQVTLNLSEHTHTFELHGRKDWAMAQLANAGPRGVAHGGAYGEQA
jgi:hypothetical protein